MGNLIKNLIDAARRFSGFDFAALKLYVLSIGILLGTYFSCFFREYIVVIWILAVITFIILIVKVIKYYKK